MRAGSYEATPDRNLVGLGVEYRHLSIGEKGSVERCKRSIMRIPPPLRSKGFRLLRVTHHPIIAAPEDQVSPRRALGTILRERSTRPNDGYLIISPSAAKRSM